MQRRFRVSVEEQERLLHTELVKLSVPFDEAAKVAKILASRKPDEFLTSEEIQLTKRVCKTWLERRDRALSLRSQLDEVLVRER